MSLLWWALTEASACTEDAPATLTLDPLVEDVLPPLPPEVVGLDVSRGGGQDGKGCGTLGSIVLTVARPDGDPDGEEAVGYRLRLVDGALPQSLGLPSDDAAPWLGPELFLSWSDAGEPFEATLALVPVDVAGNEGEPAEIVVGDAGAACGCRSAPGSGLGALLLLGGLVRRGPRRS